MLLVLFARQTKYSPHPGFLASLAKHVRERAGNVAGRFQAFRSIIHDPHGAVENYFVSLFQQGSIIHKPQENHVPVLGEDNEIHARETNLDSLNNLADFLGILHYFFRGMETRHGVLKDADTDRVFIGKNLSDGNRENGLLYQTGTTSFVVSDDATYLPSSRYHHGETFLMLGIIILILFDLGRYLGMLNKQTTLCRLNSLWFTFSSATQSGSWLHFSSLIFRVC